MKQITQLLFFFEKKNRKFIEEEVIWKIIAQVILAIEECHQHKGGAILHRDIKPDNIFLDNQNNIKVPLLSLLFEQFKLFS